jgi:hypothetical protein
MMAFARLGQARKISDRPPPAPPAKSSFGIVAVLLLAVCVEVSQAQATKCAGDVTLMSESVLLCDGQTQMSADEVVEITGDLRLTSLPADIGWVILPNLVAIGQDLYVAEDSGMSGNYYYDGGPSLDAGLSFPSLVNVSGSVTFEHVNSVSVELPSLRNLGGSLAFTNVYSVSVELPSLRNLGGSLAFTYVNSNDDMSTLSLPALTHIGSNLYFSRAYYGELDLPLLRDVGGNLDFNSYSRFTKVDLPSLRGVGGYANFDWLYADTLSMPALTTIGSYFHLEDCRARGSSDGLSLDIDKLESVGSRFRLEDSYLASVNASALQTVGSEFSITEIEGGLTKLSFESLEFVRGYFEIQDCDSLTVAYFNSLASIGFPEWSPSSKPTRAPSEDDHYSGSNNYNYYNYNYANDGSRTTSCSASGDYEKNMCIDRNNALDTIAFRSLDYDLFDIAASSGRPVFKFNPCQLRRLTRNAAHSRSVRALRRRLQSWLLLSSERRSNNRFRYDGQRRANNAPSAEHHADGMVDGSTNH